MLVQAKLLTILNEVLNQSAFLRKGGMQATYFCPSCNHHKRKLEVNLETGQWHCWTCDIKGSYLGSLLSKVKAPKKYRDQIHQLTGDIRLMRRKKKSDSSELVLPDEFISMATPSDSIEYKNAKCYLKKRKILDEDICRYNIGYCEEGEYANHIIIPSYDADGKLNFFIGRRYYDVENSISYKKPNIPMNIVGFECFVNYNHPLNLCEGVFDAMAIRNNAIPLFGKYLQPKLKAAIIINKVKQVNMILDNDAIKDAIKNYQYLTRLGVEVNVIKLDGKDPSVLGYERIHKLIRESTPFEFENYIAHTIGL